MWCFVGNNPFSCISLTLLPLLPSTHSCDLFLLHPLETHPRFLLQHHLPPSFLSFLIPIFMATWRPQWSYPLHWHVWDVDQHVATSRPGQEMPLQVGIQGRRSIRAKQAPPWCFNRRGPALSFCVSHIGPNKALFCFRHMIRYCLLKLNFRFIGRVTSAPEMICLFCFASWQKKMRCHYLFEITVLFIKPFWEH